MSNYFDLYEKKMLSAEEQVAYNLYKKERPNKLHTHGACIASNDCVDAFIAGRDYQNNKINASMTEPKPEKQDTPLPFASNGIQDPESTGAAAGRGSLGCSIMEDSARLIVEVEGLKINSPGDIIDNVRNEAINAVIDLIRNHYAPASNAPKAWQDAREEMLEGWGECEHILDTSFTNRKCCKCGEFESDIKETKQPVSGAPEYPECSGDSNNCPENEGFGCCDTDKFCLARDFEEWALLPPKLILAKDGDGDYEDFITKKYYNCFEMAYRKGMWGAARKINGNLCDENEKLKAENERLKNELDFLSGKLRDWKPTPLPSGGEILELSDVEALIGAYDFAKDLGKSLEAIQPNIDIVKELLAGSKASGVLRAKV